MHKGSEVAIIAAGSFYQKGENVARLLSEQGIDATLINPRYLNAVDAGTLDILVSSNLERLLYNVTDENAALVANYMKRLNTEGVYQIDNDVLKRVQTEFFGAWVESRHSSCRYYDFGMEMATKTP